MSIASDLRALLGKDLYIVDDPEILISYQRDQAPFAKAEMPAAALIAKNVDEVSQVMKFANERGIPIVTRGAGSGLAGGANAINDSIVISTEKLNRIISIDPINQIAVVEAGVINKDLDKAAAEVGLAYYPDPASRE